MRQMGSTRRQIGRAADSTALEIGARIGLVAYGVVHLLIAGIAIQVAWSSTGKDASAGGALKSLAGKPFGAVILWVTVIGLAALAVWQITEAIWGHRETDGAQLWWKRTRSIGRTVAYAAIAGTAGKIAIGAGGSSGSGSSEESATSGLMGAPLGRWLVAAVGIGVVAIAALQAARGARASFTDDLAPGATTGASGTSIKRLGQIGYVTKGVALAIVGLLFAWAAITYDPDKAGGLDDALKALRDQPFGPYLLSAVAVGLAAFGAYCFAWSRHLDQ
jgi:hypothetical protein